MSDFKNLDVNSPKTTSLRFIIDYIVQIDELVLRIDAKIDGKQHTTMLCSTSPITSQESQSIRATDDLLTPGRSVEACLNTKVAKSALIASLKELLQKLES